MISVRDRGNGIQNKLCEATGKDNEIFEDYPKFLVEKSRDFKYQVPVYNTRELVPVVCFLHRQHILSLLIVLWIDTQ